MPPWSSLAVRWRPRVLELGLVILLAIWVIAAALDAEDRALPIAWGLAVVAVVGFGRRWPLAALGVAFLGLYSVDAVDGGRPLEDVFLINLVWACFVVGRWARLRRQPWAAAGVLLLLSTNVTQPGRDVSVADVAFPVLFTAAPWLLGLALQLTSRRADQATSYAGELVSSRSKDIRRATDEERLRIAHELHDVVAHNLSSVSLQAQVTRRHLEDGQPVTVADLAALEDSARLAMTDLRRLLGVLRTSGDEAATAPIDGLGNLPMLVEQCRSAGQEVRTVVEGDPRELPPALSLVAFRIVQEALTNARRHGERGTATLNLTWAEGRLTMTVTNPYVGDGNADPGHGRRGMDERARLFGGEVVSSGERGSWVIQAILPTPVETAVTR